jgi:hypothetical protein
LSHSTAGVLTFRRTLISRQIKSAFHNTVPDLSHLLKSVLKKDTMSLMRQAIARKCTKIAACGAGSQCCTTDIHVSSIVSVSRVELSEVCRNTRQDVLTLDCCKTKGTLTKPKIWTLRSPDPLAEVVRNSIQRPSAVTGANRGGSWPSEFKQPLHRTKVRFMKQIMKVKSWIWCIYQHNALQGTVVAFVADLRQRNRFDRAHLVLWTQAGSRLYL